MRINKPEHIDDEQYKRYLVNISENLLNSINQQTNNLSYLTREEREYVNSLLQPIITSHTIKDNVYKLADVSLAIKQIKSPHRKNVEEFSDMVYDAHLALHTLNIIMQTNKNQDNNSIEASTITS